MKFEKFAKLKDDITIEQFVEALFGDPIEIEDDDVRLYEIAKNKIEFGSANLGEAVFALFRFNQTAYTTYAFEYEDFNYMFEVL